MKRFIRVVDIVAALMGVIGVLQCSIEWWLGHPVRPSWFWGVAACYAWADIYMTRLIKKGV